MTEMKKLSTFLARVDTSWLTEEQLSQFISDPDAEFEVKCQFVLGGGVTTKATLIFDEVLMAEVQITDDLLDVVKVTNRGLYSAILPPSTTTYRGESELVLTISETGAIYIAHDHQARPETWVAYPKEVLVGLHHITDDRTGVRQQPKVTLIDHSGRALGVFEEFLPTPLDPGKIDRLNTYCMAVFRVPREVLYEKFSDFVQVPQPVGHGERPFFMPKSLKFYALELPARVEVQTSTQTISTEAPTQFYELMETEDGSEVTLPPVAKLEYRNRYWGNRMVPIAYQ